MSTHPGMLLAFDAASGDVVGTLDYCVQYADDPDRTPLGLVDFAAHEEAGGELTDIWVVGGGVPLPGQEGGVTVDAATARAGVTVVPDGSAFVGYVPGTEWTVKGSKVWPEYLGSRAHDFRVELVGPPGAKHIGALVHKVSGHRRERAAIEGAISERIAAANGGPADIRDLVGGPDVPLLLDEQGRTRARVPRSRPLLPIVGVR